MTQDLSLKELLQELAEQRGFDFRGYKKTTLERRFRKRMFQLNIGSYAEYAEYIRRKPDEVNPLLTTILINVTEFFRDPPAWEILRQEILPAQFKQLKPGATYRVWSAGCASGEEPYSLAILLADYLGPKLQHFDIKIYATDIDEEELTTARRAEYRPHAVRRVRPEWRQSYFHGDGMLRVNREVRRLVIFGRSNLAQDAPISRVNLLLCRNVLIYFDAESQQQILSHFNYAIEPDGILFLGKSESQLANSRHFRRLNARWRIFQCLPSAAENGRTLAGQEQFSVDNAPSREELERVRGQYKYMLETLRVGVIVLNSEDVIEQNNTAALSVFGMPPASLAGRRLQETEIFSSNPELGAYLQTSRMTNEAARFQSHVKGLVEPRRVEITLRPVLSGKGNRIATLIFCDDVTAQEKLQSTVEELESTAEELQSTNEELETTNEELQSANEELETTNEELQSTNEELETTNEELQSLNEEMETTNQELEERGKELDQVNNVYLQTLETMGMPIMLVGEQGQINFWNGMALRLFGFSSKPPMEVTLGQLPVPKELRTLIVRRHRSVLLKQQPVVTRDWKLGDGLNSRADIHFRFIPQNNRESNVLIMFNLHVPLNSSGDRPVYQKDGNAKKKLLKNESRLARRKGNGGKTRRRG